MVYYFFSHNENFCVQYFDEVISYGDLPVQLINPQIMEDLTKRGREFKKLAFGHSYMKYSSTLSVKSAFLTYKIKSDGRIMVDVETFNRLNPNYTEFVYNSNQQNQNQYNQNYNYRNLDDYMSNPQSKKKDQNTMEDLPEEDLFMTWPTLPGFSFAAKKWGEFQISKISPIIFDELAFEKMVLPPEKKIINSCIS